MHLNQTSPLDVSTVDGAVVVAKTLRRNNTCALAYREWQTTVDLDTACVE